MILFDTINAKTSFDRIFSDTRDYSRRAAERRKNYRVSGNFSALVQLNGVEHMAIIQNVSLSGACLDREIPLDPGSPISIALDGTGIVPAQVLTHINGRTYVQFPREFDCTLELGALIDDARSVRKSHQ